MILTLSHHARSDPRDPPDRSHSTHTDSTGRSPRSLPGRCPGTGSCSSWVIVSGIQVIQPSDLVVDAAGIAEHVIETGVGHRLGLAEVGIAVGFSRRTILPDDAVGAPLLILHIQIGVLPLVSAGNGVPRIQVGHGGTACAITEHPAIRVAVRMGRPSLGALYTGACVVIEVFLHLRHCLPGALSDRGQGALHRIPVSCSFSSGLVLGLRQVAACIVAVGDLRLRLLS